jgi:hypothetical protein
MWSFNGLRMSAVMRWPTHSLRYVLPKATTPRAMNVAMIDAG